MTSHATQLPGVKHKVIALLSGGKDSCFNLMHCEANGHEIVAVATLTPEAGTDELDSHLYQSVGTSLLPLVAQSLALPLYTGTIQGKAVARGPEYGSRTTSGQGSGTEGDETEDLTLLLRRVMAAHPEATALASGAILSTYQRLRIEHVCSRLGLVSLSYLWQQAQLPLLESMLASQVEAVIVKVAGVGLGVDIVGKELKDVMPLLRRLERQYGSHPAGEGGEYETLTLSTPMFSHRLRLVSSETVVTDPEPYPVAYLRVSEAQLEAKPDWHRPTVKELRQMLGLEEHIDGLDETSRGFLEQVGTWTSEPFASTPICPAASQRQDPPTSSVQFSTSGRWFAAEHSGSSTPGRNVGDELRDCLNAISATLQNAGLSLPLHATHVTLLISDMSLFAAANQVYTKFFGTSPPSRATIEVPLPPDCRVRVEVVGFDDRPHEVGSRRALHVQGLSYWAAANIGPYSQAVTVNERIHVAGQIPLLPASLSLPLDPPPPASPYPHQSILALQHVQRIIDALRSKNATGGGWTGWGESCVAWWANPPLQERAEGSAVVRKAWEVWSNQTDGWDETPVIFVRASGLPRGALVEFQVNVHTGRRTADSSASFDDADEDELDAVFSRGGRRERTLWEACSAGPSHGQGLKAAIFVRNHQDLTHLGDDVSPGVLSRAISVKIYYLVHVPADEISARVARLFAPNRVCLTFIPVLEIFDRDGAGATVALEVFGE